MRDARTGEAAIQTIGQTRNSARRTFERWRAVTMTGCFGLSGGSRRFGIGTE